MSVPRFYRFPIIVGTMMLLAFLFRVSNNMLLTTTPLLLHAKFHVSAQGLGLLASIYFGSMVLATFVVVSRVRPGMIEHVILLAFLLLALGLPLYALPASPQQLGLLYGTSGLACGILQPLLITLVTKYSSATYRERNLALYTLVLSGSLIVGPLIETFVLSVNNDNLREVYLLFTAFPLVGVVLCSVMLRRRQFQANQRWDESLQAHTIKSVSLWHRLNQLAHDRIYLIGFVGNIAYTIPYAIITAFGAVYIYTNFHVGYGITQLIFAVFFGASFLARCMLALMAPIPRKDLVMWIGIVATLIGLLLLGFAHTLLLFIIGFALLGVPHGILFPTATMIIAENVDVVNLGFANSILGSSISGAAFIVPPLVGLLIPKLGYNIIFLLMAGLVCIFTIVFFLLHPYSVCSNSTFLPKG